MDDRLPMVFPTFRQSPISLLRSFWHSRLFASTNLGGIKLPHLKTDKSHNTLHSDTKKKWFLTYLF